MEQPDRNLIGVLTGGGDCPGLNAAIRAIVVRGTTAGYRFAGIRNGWAGLMESTAMPLTPRSVAGILTMGGTILGTSRTNPVKMERGIERVQQTARALGLDALIAIGGDDTLGVANALHQAGFPVVGVPKTMDNDISGTDFCIGFFSAVATVTEALDKLHTTASAHHRVLVVEVMGREAGWVATYAGMAGGADYILVPEVPATLEEITRHLRRRQDAGSEYSIIVVAEGATIAGLPEPEADDQSRLDAFGHARLDKRGIGAKLADAIEAATGYETRTTVLGHLQRGGSPDAFDRVLATRLGVAAMELVIAGDFGKLPVYRNNRIETEPLATVATQPRLLDRDLYDLARGFFE